MLNRKDDLLATVYLFGITQESGMIRNKLIRLNTSDTTDWHKEPGTGHVTQRLVARCTQM